MNDELAKANKIGVVRGVAGDEAAEDDAAVEIHAVENGMHDFAADVFEVDVDAFWSGGG